MRFDSKEKYKIDREMTLAEIVKERRAELGLTQKQLAENSGVSRSMISKVENGYRGIRMTKMVRLLIAVGAGALELAPKENESMTAKKNVVVLK